MKQDRHPHPYPPDRGSAFPRAVTGDEPIASLAGFWLAADCATDGQVLLPLRLMSAKLGWNVPLRVVVDRLRCSKCGAAPTRVRLMERADGDGKSVARGREIVLRG